MKRSEKPIGEMPVKEVVPEVLLNQIMALQKMLEEMNQYAEQRKDGGYWDYFTDLTDKVKDYYWRSIYDLGEIAGNEINFRLLNPDWKGGDV